MKKILYLLLTSIVYTPFAYAQNRVATYQRSIKIKYITQDSVIMPFNEDFFLIEDSCRQIIRYAHLNRQHKFVGTFKDVSSLDPNLVLTKGNYNANGLKDGFFVARYLNGQPQAKGSFKNDEYDGKWEMFYDNGKPELFFEANGKDIMIMYAWDEKGTMIVNNGNGHYITFDVLETWTGNVLNGKPDGKWIVTSNPDNHKVGDETYKDGIFQSGEHRKLKYSDRSRLILVRNNRLPFTTAELLRISTVPCGGERFKHIVGATYKIGMPSFSENIERLIAPYLSTADIKSYNNKFTIEGTINAEGAIVNLNSKDAEAISRGLIIQLRRLPPLQPATINGKPVKQGFVISFEFESGVYHYGYRFLPISNN